MGHLLSKGYMGQVVAFTLAYIFTFFSKEKRFL